MGHRDISLRDDNNNEISVVVNDMLDIVTQSPLIAQIFARALVRVITKVVSGTVREIVIEVGATSRAIEVELNNQRVVARMTMLEDTTRECAKAVKRAEDKDYYPQAMKDELIDRLYGVFYEELSKLAPSGRLYK